jgi:hypothetical protein
MLRIFNLPEPFVPRWIDPACLAHWVFDSAGQKDYRIGVTRSSDPHFRASSVTPSIFTTPVA